MSSIFNLVPGLSEKMDIILRQYEEYHQKTYNDEVVSEDTNINTSPYKDSIKNAETPKKKSAKKKVEQLFNK